MISSFFYDKMDEILKNQRKILRIIEEEEEETK